MLPEVVTAIPSLEYLFRPPRSPWGVMTGWWLVYAYLFYVISGQDFPDFMVLKFLVVKFFLSMEKIVVWQSFVKSCVFCLNYRCFGKLPC